MFAQLLASYMLTKRRIQGVGSSFLVSNTFSRTFVLDDQTSVVNQKKYILGKVCAVCCSVIGGLVLCVGCNRAVFEFAMARIKIGFLLAGSSCAYFSTWHLVNC